MGSSSLNRDRTWAPRTGFLSLGHWTTREVPNSFSFLSFFFFPFIFISEANYFTTLQWVLSYIDMNQPWSFSFQMQDASTSQAAWSLSEG